MAPPGDDVPTPERLGVLMQELMGLVHRRFAGDAMAIMSESGLTMPQMVALFTLRYGGESSIGGLFDQLHLSVSATSHLIDRLFDKGLVHRREDPDDRRQKRIEITAEGAALVDRLAQERTQEFARALSSLDPDLQAQLVVVFERAIAQLHAVDPHCRVRPPESR